MDGNRPPPIARLHGTIAPSSIDRPRSGMTFHGSISIFTPSPVQSGHAPYGELNENRRGASSSNESPQYTHASDSLNVSSRALRPVASRGRFVQDR